MPESIVYDASHHRYLISNYSTGDIVQVDSNGVQSYFVQGGNAKQGLEIVGNVVYVGCVNGVRGFNLESGEMVLDVYIPASANINDVTADESGNLYASEVFGTRIFKIKISTQSYSVYINGQGILRPNGIFFDKNYNRILVCSYRSNSPIQAIYLSDSSVKTVVNTNISDCDGITKDKYGRCYVTSWTTKSIYRFDAEFHNPPEMVYQNNCGPADISYDSINNVIAIPLQPCNGWGVFHVLPPIGINETNSHIPENSKLFQNYPNPFNPSTNIKFQITNSSLVILKVFNSLGIEVATLVNDKLNIGEYKIPFSVNRYPNIQFPSGVYFYGIKIDNYYDTKKMVLIK